MNKRYKKVKWIQGLRVGDDPYVAGVAAEKLGVNDAILRQSSVLDPKHKSDVFSAGEARRLYQAGRQLAGQCTWADIGWTLKRIHGHNYGVFARYVQAELGQGAWDDISLAMETATDPDEGVPWWLTGPSGGQR